MPRGDGVDRTVVRNTNLSQTQITNTQRHNERTKESYRNPDIVPERSPLNIHFKTPTGSYEEMFADMVEQKIISTRGLKSDAKLYGELIFDVNSAYFYNHGDYEFAKKFYETAYRAAVEIVGDEQFILSAVMHADERNKAMSEALGEDVYHYHLHVVYIPVVEKQILWSKRCKDESLRGTVKETIMQVSSSKKWLSKPAVDENGQPILQKNGKPVLKKSYSVLQDDFFQFMRKAGYDDIERGERGSTEEHLTVTQFKVAEEQRHLEELTAKVEKKEARIAKADDVLKVRKEQATAYQDIDQIGRKTLTGKIEMTQDESKRLKDLAKEAILSRAKISTLTDKLAQAKKDTEIWKNRYEELKEQAKDFLAAVKKAPEKVKAFLDSVLHMERPESQRSRARLNRDRSVSR